MDMFSMDCFLALVRSRKFSTAAELMHLSQSSFSRQIQMLESSFDTKLFTRDRFGCDLTESGRALLPFAERLVSELSKAERLIDDYKIGRDNRLVICTDCLPNPKLSEMIQGFQDQYPYVTIEILEKRSDLSIAFLQDNPDVVCIINSAFGSSVDGFDYYPLFPEELVALIGKRHPLAKLDRIKLSMLCDEQFQIMHTRNTQFYDFFAALCEKNGFTPKASLNVFWLSTMPEAIAKLNLVSVTPRSVAERICTDSIKILEIEDIGTYSIQVVKRKSDASYVANLLFEYFK